MSDDVAVEIPAFLRRPAEASPDAALLALCASLRELQEHWQALWAATPDEHDAKAPTPADQAFDDFSKRVWPGFEADPASDPAAALLTTPATTPEGFRAKAGALRAIYDAGNYTGCCRDDECQLMAEFLGEVAAESFMVIGEEPKESSLAVVFSADTQVSQGRRQPC